MPENHGSQPSIDNYLISWGYLRVLPRSNKSGSDDFQGGFPPTIAYETVTIEPTFGMGSTLDQSYPVAVRGLFPIMTNSAMFIR